MKIALVLLAGDPEATSWDAGPLEVCEPSPGNVAQAVEACLARSADLVAVWDARLGPPDAEEMRRIARLPGDVWHAGLRLGQGGRPALIDTVHPTWMLNRDPPSHLEASSWRLSLRACLAKAGVWRRLGGPDPGYATLDGAALELGHRWFWGGALMRHVPRLIAEARLIAETRLIAEDGREGVGDSDVPPADQLRFFHQRSGRFWATWAALRGVTEGLVPPRALVDGWRQRRAPRTTGAHLTEEDRGIRGEERPSEEARVSVLIPTLDRYPYLDVVLRQLARQSVPPHEVVVIDQTSPARRRRDWHEVPGLPLRVIERDRPGQSSARNAGLDILSGDVVLFLDDDVEIEPDLIEGHLACLERWRADASCGVAEETGAGPLPEGFRHRRTSDVFPTCNAALRRSALEKSGLFDLAFDRGSRADADLGIRLYLSGALLVLDPSLSVLHHKAPAGGLRQHRARVATYAASRRSLVRHLPSVTEIYLAKRHFSPRQAREMVWLRVFGTLRAHGGAGRQLAKLVAGLVRLPDTLARIASRSRRAARMLEEFPRIPPLPGASASATSEDPGSGPVGRGTPT